MRSKRLSFRGAQDYFRHAFSIPVLITKRPSNYSETTKIVRVAGTPDENGVKPIIKQEVVEGHCRGSLADYELMMAWNHLSDEEVLRSLVPRGPPHPPEDPSTIYTRERVARLRGLL